MAQTQQIRLGVLSQWYEPEPAAVAGSISRSLVALGYETHVLTGFPNYPDGKFYPGYKIKPYQYEHVAGVHVHRVALVPSHDRSPARRAVNYLSYAASAATRLRILRSVDVWLVNSTPATVALPAMVAQAVLGRPYVLLIQDLWPESVVESGFVARGRALSAMERGIHTFCDASYRRAAAVAVTGPGMADILRRRGVPDSKLIFVPNWVDETVFRPVPRDDALARGLGLDGFVVMYAGNLGELQGLETAIEAARLLRDITDLRLVFVGSGVAEPRLRAAAEGAGNVTFLGRQPGDRMPQLLALGDVQLISLMNVPLLHSTLPSKLQSTLASGRPVIGSVPGDAARIIEQSGAGLAVPPGDPNALADAVRRLYALSPEAREAMGQAGRRYYLDRMSAGVGSVTLAGLLERAVTTHRGRAPARQRQTNDGSPHA
jgi:colanic acid biosynthesis glycosyl transferase WcaI